MDLEASKKKVLALTEPRNVVLVGASDRPGAWAWRVLRNLKQYEFPQPIYLINPRREEIGGDRCYPDFASLPAPPDHLVVLVPAPGVPDVLRSGAAAGARSATVFSSGFGEAFDAKGAALGRELAAVIAETGIAVSGPNCMGNVCAKTRFVTLAEDRPLTLRPGPVALVGQSGGMMIFLNAALEERGMIAEYLITSGNEAGLSIPDYIAFFADQPELKVIIVYIEAITELEKFKAACRMARVAGKSIVAIKLGQSERGRSAAMAHTASLAGSIAAFDAVAGELGVIRADTLDDAVEITELLVHTGAPGGRRLGAITLSGAFRGLLYDAAEANGLQFPKLAHETTAKLNAILTVGSLVSNPIDGGFGVLSSDDNYKASIAALQADPNVDMILIQENLPREPGSDRAERYIATVDAIAAAGAPKPIAFITPVSHSQSDYSRALRAKSAHVSFLLEVNKALRAIASVARRDELEHLAPATMTAATPLQSTAAARVRALAKSGATTLDEIESKALLRAYGIATPAEIAAHSPDDAVKAARQIGYPVVLKAVSARLPHKTEAGAVVLHLAADDAVRAAYGRIDGNVRRAGVEKLDAMLVCQQIVGGLELVLGLHRDPEMGLVVMAGSGGVLLELAKDVGFAVPPITPDKACAILARTHAARLMAGYRAAPRLDADAVVDALVALGRIADDLADVVQSIDINPFVVLPRGGFALDALFVARA
ncbi:MAG TPA: acetate--CoA ligase family protein [Xanthobacteraceae bacterium]|nr:acetate--CoA ligase family protein [Xanthobacteraceae bacterium]